MRSFDEATARGTRCIAAAFLQAARLTRYLIGAPDAFAQLRILCGVCDGCTACDLRIAQSRFLHGARVCRRGLRVRALLVRDLGACAAGECDLAYHAAARIIIDTLNDLGCTHPHFVFPNGIWRIEKEFPVLHIDGAHAACNHLPHDVMPMT